MEWLQTLLASASSELSMLCAFLRETLDEPVFVLCGVLVLAVAVLGLERKADGLQKGIEGLRDGVGGEPHEGSGKRPGERSVPQGERLPIAGRRR